MASTTKESFGSRFGIIAAAAGSAIGLGNIWKFPYIVGEYGGGAFLLVYLICIVLVGMPVLLSELVIGRSTGGNSVTAYEELTDNKIGKKLGWLGVATCFLILSFYSVVAGWIIKYFILSLTGSFNGASSGEINNMFGSFVSQGVEPVLWSAIFICAAAGVIGLGVTKGIEKSAKILMPCLLALLVGLAIYSLTLDGASEAMRYLFVFDFSKLNSEAVLMALSHSFFTLSVGITIMIVYGSYVKKDQNLGSITVSVALADTAIALIAGIVIFPIVFTAGLDTASGPSLLFITLPTGLASAGIMGVIVCSLFFFLMILAALSSAISLLEVIASYFADKGYNRRKVSFITAGLVMILATVCSLSQGAITFNIGSRDFMTFIMDTVDAFLFPIGALIAVIFAGWILKKESFLGEVGDGKFANGYYYVTKYVAPLLVVAIFITVAVSFVAA